MLHFPTLEANLQLNRSLPSPPRTHYALGDDYERAMFGLFADRVSRVFQVLMAF